MRSCSLGLLVFFGFCAVALGNGFPGPFPPPPPPPPPPPAPPPAPERPSFHRGDSTGDGVLDVADAVSLLNFLYAVGDAPGCLEAADVDNDGLLNLTDAVRVLNFLFLGGDPPPAPGPTSFSCGVDPDPIGSELDLGCDRYDAC